MSRRLFLKSINSFLILAGLFVLGFVLWYGHTNQEKDITKSPLPLRAPGISAETEAEVPLKRIVEAIAAFNEADGKYTGYAATTSVQYKRYEWLQQFATSEQLIRLTDHPNPVVRVYAFWILTERGHPDCKNILEKHLDDTEQFMMFSACKKEKMCVNESFFLTMEPTLNQNEAKIIVSRIQAILKKAAIPVCFTLSTENILQ